jgi:PTS system nitrogen regulatory IIA component
MILTLKELADYLRVNERTILRMLNTGQLKGTKIGGQWRFNSSQIDSLFFPADQGEANEVLNELAASSPRVQVPLSRAINENQVFLDLKSTTADQVLKELARPSVFSMLVMDLPEFQKRLQAREELLSTGIGNGVAIPHPRDPEPALRRPAIMVYGRSKAGIPFNAADGKPVHHFFLLSCQSIETHLHLMACLAQLLRHESFLAGCNAADKPGDILKLILEMERQQFLKK